jgi:hypothetical protein
LKPNVITPKKFIVKEIVQKLAIREEIFFELTQAIIHRCSLSKKLIQKLRDSMLETVD